MSSIFDIDSSGNKSKVKVSAEGALFQAVSKGRIDLVRVILAASMDSERLNLHFAVNGFNSAHVAARKGKTEILSILLEYDPSLINTRTRDAKSLHMIAAYENHIESLQLICQQIGQSCDEDINGKAFLQYVDNIGNTVLHYSVWGGSLSCTKYLVETCGANVQEKNNEGMSPLQLACAGNHTEIVAYLLSLSHNDGQNLSTDLSSAGLNSIHRAAQYGSLEAIKMLTSKSSNLDIDINTKSLNGTTALHLATKDGNFDVLKYLIESCNADIDIENDFGLTAAHLCCTG